MAIGNCEIIFTSCHTERIGFGSGQRARDTMFVGPLYASYKQLFDQNVPQLVQRPKKMQHIRI